MIHFLRHKYLWPLILALLSVSAAHAELVLDSGQQRNTLIELYTSEGCSSCPPAEALLNRFVDDPELWTRYIPVAFHVDYWDYLGWRDPYAAAQHSARQRQYANSGNTRAVYTPGFMVNGKEWRPRFREQRPALEKTTAGRLRITVRDQHLEARYSEAERAAAEPLVLHVAILGLDLHTRIQAGERAGREARHEFVVLNHQQFESAGGQWRFALDQAAANAEGRTALAAWVSRPGDLTPVQATGGYLPHPLP